ncbi:MAG TPA: AbrB/MazE/SpoVT family DNA-binding domain-containing protein [Isosphaeraceae bacterium]|jgi:AbrB family looped-hinge helix DNA binding protein
MPQSTPYEPSSVSEQGAVVLPADLRRRFGMEAGTRVVAEEREDGVLIRPAVRRPVRIYSDQQIAEFLLNNAVNAEDYEIARAEVRRLGLDPDTVDHLKPRGL